MLVKQKRKRETFIRAKFAKSEQWPIGLNSKMIPVAVSHTHTLLSRQSASLNILIEAFNNASIYISTLELSSEPSVIRSAAAAATTYFKLTVSISSVIAVKRDDFSRWFRWHTWPFFCDDDGDDDGALSIATSQSELWHRSFLSPIASPSLLPPNRHIQSGGLTNPVDQSSAPPPQKIYILLSQIRQVIVRLDTINVVPLLLWRR